MLLGRYYARKYRSIKRGDEDGMGNLLLSILYWFGKGAEMKENESRCKSIVGSDPFQDTLTFHSVLGH